MAVRFSFCQLDILKETLVSRSWGFVQGQPGWDSIADRGSLEARAPEFWPLTGPSLVGTAVETVGPALELLGPCGLEKCFLTRIPSVGKESWSAQEGKMSGVILVGKDRDRGRISRDVTWGCIVAGSET